MIRTMSIGVMFILYSKLFSQISMSARFYGNAQPNGKGEIEVSIQKQNINSFAKYQLEVPSGVSVSDIDVKGGNFVMEDNKAKVIWVNLPSKNTFNIKLKIIFNDHVNFPVTLYQKFYYLENSVKKEIQAEPLHIKASETIVTEIKPDGVSNHSISVQAPATHVATANQTSSNTQNTNAANMSPSKKEEMIVSPTTNHKISDNEAYTYKIQIAASATKPDINAYSRAGKVEIVQHNGMYKVLLDKIFSTKEEALEYREKLIQQGYNGAFLVKYFKGQRVN